MSNPNRGRARRLAAIALAALLAAGCAQRADEPKDTPTKGTQHFPVTVTPPSGKPVTIDKQPKRIVSLSASDTETLYAVGAGDQVVAVDEQSNYPPDAPRTKLSGLTPNVEAIAGYDPDLVVVSDDADNLVASLGKLDRKVLVVPAAATLDDLYAEIELIGAATGHASEGKDLAARTKHDLDKLAADTPKKHLTYYHELDKTFYSATSKTFIGQVYGLFGLTNIADPADKDSGGYPQLSAEAILKANPDLIFLADTKCCGQNAKTVAARPGWGSLKAVKDGNVVPLDDDLASRWGPRVVDLARDVAAAVTKASGD